MSWPVDGGGVGRPTLSSNGSLSNPQIGDIWTIVTPSGVEAGDYSMTQDRGAGPITLTLNGPLPYQHVVAIGDIAPVGQFWPVVVRDLQINLVSLPINTGPGPQVPAAPTMGTAVAGDNTATVPYTDGSNGGSAITSHDLQIYDGSGNLIGTITGVANPALLTSAQGILNGGTYKFKARANNIVGPSPYATVFSNTVMPTDAPVVAPYQGQVATNTFIPDFRIAANLFVGSRSPHLMMADVPTVRIKVPNWYVAGSVTETDGSQPLTVDASIEYPAGNYTRITFSGINSGVGASGANILSDPVVAPPKGAKFWVRMRQQAPGGVMCFRYYAADGTSKLTGSATSGGVPDYVMGGGEWGAQAANTVQFMCMPCAIVYDNSTTPAVGIYGDSISVGTNDLNDGSRAPYQGHLGRAFGSIYPAGHVGVFGDTMQSFLAGNSRRLGLAQHFSHIVIHFGINDVTGGRTAANLATYTNSMIALFASKPVAVCTLGPVTTSTDAWITIANQTVVASEPVRVAVNTQRNTNMPTARVCYDINQVIENIPSPEDGKFSIVGGSNTSDGTHWNANSCGRVAAAINVASLVF